MTAHIKISKIHSPYSHYLFATIIRHSVEKCCFKKPIISLHGKITGPRNDARMKPHYIITLECATCAILRLINSGGDRARMILAFYLAGQQECSASLSWGWESGFFLTQLSTHLFLMIPFSPACVRRRRRTSSVEAVQHFPLIAACAFRHKRATIWTSGFHPWFAFHLPRSPRCYPIDLWLHLSLSPCDTKF
jgi:hypothetical protein